MGGRRKFIGKLLAAGAASSGITALSHAQKLEQAQWLLDPLNPEKDTTNEDYWTVIQQAYTVNANVLNLNNGGVSPAPRVVQEALKRYNDLSNEAPSYYMWRVLDMGREPLRMQLARLAGCDAEEIAINRNATEALNTIIYGLPLQRGDEVIGTKQDYPNMIQAWQQRQEREGVFYKQLSFNFPIESDEEIVKAFEDAITPRTKLLHLTHIINWVGQILPVRKIADMAKAKGIEILVDGAHSFGLLDFKISDLNADYFGTSLHKFLSAPIGSGMLWIKKEKIGRIWPLLCNGAPRGNDIRKFETLGTRSFPIEQAIGEAIHFQEGIGNKRKQERIHYLKNYWASEAIKIPRVQLHTSLLPQYSCAIAGISMKGMTPFDLDQMLMNKYKIHTVAIVWENISCVRITPHVFTRTQDLDRLLTALNEIAKS